MSLLFVLKYGGATISTPEKIKRVAQDIALRVQQGDSLIVVVSAMGETTNALIALAEKITNSPAQREYDMLISTGERVSMALMTMALLDLKIPAISFTGSQAGIITTNEHINARILKINPIRVYEALKKNKVVVIAGFQGVADTDKEITTLGRGGSDTTAVALAAHFKAQACEILKDVASIYSADPKKIPNAKELNDLSYEVVLNMTYWGAKFLHYRSVELAFKEKVPLWIGPAENHKQKGTQIMNLNLETSENVHIIAMNSFVHVLQIEYLLSEPILDSFLSLMEQHQIPDPQMLDIENKKILLTGSDEITSRLKKLFQSNTNYKVSTWSSITLTATGVTAFSLIKDVLDFLKENGIVWKKINPGPLSLTIYIEPELCVQTQSLLHERFCL